MKTLSGFILLFLLFSCQFEQTKNQTQRSTIFVGIDVSGSFTKTKKFKDGMKFLGQYIEGHLKGEGGLSVPVDLYIGGIGGNSKEDPQDFYPVHEFRGLSAKEIESKLNKEFSHQKDNLTDFNTFFKRIKTMVKQKNLFMAPIDVIMITDGVPEIAGRSKLAIKQGYSNINLSPLEYLTRNINIRILYTGPKVGNNWRKYVPTKKIKIWTVEPNVMYGWQGQLTRHGKVGLYTWVRDNIDLKIRSRGL